MKFEPGDVVLIRAVVVSSAGHEDDGATYCVQVPTFGSHATYAWVKEVAVVGLDPLLTE